MKIEFSDDAIAQIEIAVDYYNSISEWLGNYMLDDLDEALSIIISSRLIFQVRYSKVRLVHLNKFPYSIHFEVFEKRVEVYKFLHQKQYG